MLKNKLDQCLWAGKLLTRFSHAVEFKTVVNVHKTLLDSAPILFVVTFCCVKLVYVYIKQISLQAIHIL